MEAKSGDVKPMEEEVQENPGSGEAKNEAMNEKKDELAGVVGQNDGAKQVEAGSCGLSMIHPWTTIGNCNRPAAMANSGQNAATLAPMQLTIFYGGSVNVFDAIPPEKVREILMIASAAAKQGELKSSGSYCPSLPVLTRSPSMQSTATPLASPRSPFFPVQQNPLCKLQADLPIARRHSLQRFLEKRRDRLVSKTPYASPSASKVDEDKETDLGAISSSDAACVEKAPISQEEHQLKAAAQLAGAY